MVSCITSASRLSGCQVHATERHERQFEESSLILYYICLSDNSYELLKLIVDMWFTGEDFEDECWSKYPLEDLNLSRSPRWRRPSRICKNIELLKPVNQWIRDKQYKYDIVLGARNVQEENLDPISKLQTIPGWIAMNTPDMRKEVVYFMSHLLMTEYGEKLWEITVDLYDLSNYTPWHTAVQKCIDCIAYKKHYKEWKINKTSKDCPSLQAALKRYRENGAFVILRIQLTMDNNIMKLINDACNYYEQNQPTPVKWKDYRVGDINTFVLDPELDKIVKGPWITVSSSELIEEVIGIIFNERFIMYDVYYNMYASFIPGKLYRLKHSSENDWPILRSHIRMTKQYNKNIIQYYRDAVHEFNSVVKTLLDLYITTEVFYCKRVLRRMSGRFKENMKKLSTNYFMHIRWSFGLFDCIVSINPIIRRALHDIILTTDITVFEFLIMDLNLTHLPILNQEELMVENNREIEGLIRGRCKKLKEIYDTHLIFNEKYPNFPEDCTNHILKYCQENYVLQGGWI